MLDRPPPSTITSGSRMSQITASPRASRSACRSSAARARRVAGGGARRASCSRPWRSGPSQLSREARPGEVEFEAAPVPAPARRIRQLVRRRPGEGRVPPLARDPVAPGDHAPVHGDSAAAPRPDDDAEHRAAPGPRAVHRLAQREAVGVVLDPHLPPERLAEVAVEGVADQGLGVGVLDQAGRRADDAGDADAHARAHPRLALRGRHEIAYRRHDPRILARGRRPAPQPHGAGLVEDRDLRLGAAQVHADSPRHGPRLSPVPHACSRPARREIRGDERAPPRRARPVLPACPCCGRTARCVG